MSMPISKGARFRVMAGEYQGREGTIVCTILDSADVWILNLGEGAAIDFTQADADGPVFQRLADAPVKPDPLFAEIGALEAKRSAFRGGPEFDDRRDTLEWLDLIRDETLEDHHDDGRDALLAILIYALAGIRSIDRGAG